VVVYIHSLLLMLFGAILVEAGIRITTVYFWLLVVIVFGILLTYDMLIVGPEDVERNKKE